MNLLRLVLTLCLLGSAACQSPGRDFDKVVRVGTNPVPHNEILEHVKPRLEKRGISLELFVFNDYVQPNLRTLDGDIDANFFQTAALFDVFNADNGDKLVAVAQVHIEPFGIYAPKLKDLKDLPDGALVLMPSEVSNDFRALRLLHGAGIIRLGHPNALYGGASDVVDNPKHLRFKPIEAAMLPRAWKEADLAGINTNYALAAGLRPDRDALLVEDQRAPYANLLVARRDRSKSKALAALREELLSDDTRQFIRDKYKGALIPVF